MTQAEADRLLALDKRFDEPDPLELGPEKWTRNLTAVDLRERFLFDYFRGRIIFAKYRYQMRHGATEILLRYDSHGRHTNPPNPHHVGSFDGPHVHLYREGYDDRIAFPVSEARIEDTSDAAGVLSRILGFCHVVTIPPIQLVMAP
jgi:hypothetical protein